MGKGGEGRGAFGQMSIFVGMRQTTEKGIKEQSGRMHFVIYGNAGNYTFRVVKNFEKKDFSQIFFARPNGLCFNDGAILIRPFPIVNPREMKGKWKGTKRKGKSPKDWNGTNWKGGRKNKEKSH